MDFTLDITNQKGRYPFIATAYGFDEDGEGRMIFNRAEAEMLRDRLNALIAEYDDITTSYVQVSFNRATNSAEQLYTYRDPSNELAVGDYVLVPARGSGNDVMATVRALGRGTWTGPISLVSAKMIREDLS
jgi:hypothetical protein